MASPKIRLQLHYETFLATFRDMVDNEGNPLFKAVYPALQRPQDTFPYVEIYFTDHFQAQIIVGEITDEQSRADIELQGMALYDRLWSHYRWRFAFGYIMHDGRLYRCMGHHFWDESRWQKDGEWV